MRVCAVNGTKRAPVGASSCSRCPYCLASTTIDRPSGVSSASDDICAASASSASETPGIGTNSAAWRLPSVIVPVLSSSSTSTSPEASTARPESASTLRRTRRSMPAIPIALSSAPIVVGMSARSGPRRGGGGGGGGGRGRGGGGGGGGAGGAGQGQQRGDDDQEDDGQRAEQDVQRDLVG